MTLCENARTSDHLLKRIASMSKSSLQILGIMTIFVSIVVFMFVDQAISRPTNIFPNRSMKENISLNFSYWNNQNKLNLREYINIDNDNSLYKYVNKQVPLHDIKYVPAMLVAVDSPYIIQRSK